MLDSVLIVDDIDINRLILKEILSESYDVLEAENGFEALDILMNIGEVPQAVLLDIMMPGMDGFEVLARMKQNERTAKIPVLFITAADATTYETQGLSAGAVDFISKPFNPDVVKARVDNHIQLKHYRDNLEGLLERKTSELVATHQRTLETLATIIEYRDLESGKHIHRTSELTKLLVESMLRTERFAGEMATYNTRSLIKAVALHDIGKVGIPDSILLKPGRLTPEEFETIKKHTVIGGQIIDSISQGLSDEAGYLRLCREICLYHHERWDGKGYPEGLAGLDIPLSARIISVVDVYDALMSKRCYKPAFTHEEALRLLKEGAGTQFDADIIDAMMIDHERFHRLEDAMSD